MALKHLACIMDGNRRWAREHGVLPWYGHRKGIDVLSTVFDFCLDYSIEHLSLYAFSLENLNRPATETQFLFDLITSEAETIAPECIRKGARLRFCGDWNQFPDCIRETCRKLEADTESGTALQVNILFCYGGRQDLVHAVRELVRIRSNTIGIHSEVGMNAEIALTEQDISDHLWTKGIPDPDLIIRTGGSHRLSNFLLYQAAYSELYFTDTLWPNMTREEFEKGYQFFTSCQRNFGL